MPVAMSATEMPALDGVYGDLRSSSMLSLPRFHQMK
jgi:hypothetical protein